MDAPIVKFDGRKKAFVKGPENKSILKKHIDFATKALLVVSSAYKVEPKDIVSKSSVRSVNIPRRAFFKMMHIQFPKLSLRNIGAFTAHQDKKGRGKDHASVISAIQKHDRDCKLYSNEKELFERVCALLKGKIISAQELRLMTFTYSEVKGILEGNGVYDMIVTEDMLKGVDNSSTKKVA